MKKIYNFLISMTTMAVLLIMYAVAMAVATFVENDYGAIVSKHFIYQAWWFELIQLLLTINMIGNIFKYKLYKKEKWSILTFHVAFIIILIGAGITRYISFEGTMHIREGELSNTILSGESFFQVDLTTGNDKAHFEKEVFISPMLKNKLKEEIEISGKKINIELKNIIPNPKETVVEVIGGKPIIELVFSSHGKMDSHYLADKSTIAHGKLHFSFNQKNDSNSVQIFTENDRLYIRSPYELNRQTMSGTIDTVFSAGEKIALQVNQIYSVGEALFVVTNYYKMARISYIPGDVSNGIEFFALEFDVKSENEVQKAEVLSAYGSMGIPAYTNINGVNVKLVYGVKEIHLPFSLKLRDFQLDRYPGSESPSSYASEVTLIDKEHNVKKDYRIFMNNVLDYRGYRFFQSSYDKDEQGTILSVNKDKAGTLVTYLGYFLLALGMFWSIFNKNSYFVEMLKKTSDIRNKRKELTTVALIISMFISQSIFAQSPRPHVDAEHAKKFGALFVQDNGSRTKPYNTLTSELLRKVSRKEKFLGLSPNQVFLGMVFNQEFWKDVKMIKVSNPELKRVLGVEGKYVSFNDLVNLQKQEYKLKSYVNKAFNKEPSHRTKFDKDVIAVDERVNIVYQIFSGGYLSVFPVPGDSHHRWLNPAESKYITNNEDREFVAGVFSDYYNAMVDAEKSGDWTKPNQILQKIKDYQRKYGADILPSETKLKMEIQYVNIDIFDSIYKYYGLIGFVLLLVLFAGILRPKMKTKTITVIAAVLLGLLFILHTYGLGLRWYISGHAPWSNGYESMIYIAWATMLAGFLFMKKSPITLAATSLLASITLMVAHLSWMDPQITNLVPVLKSYWLTIHVSVITASYGFLALCALLGFLSLILMIFKSEKNKQRIDLTIAELTNINHISMIAGLYLLTLGTFLGGVWANESWGRYWGWDPKETWSLITIIIYTFVTHTRFIPALYKKYSFNLLSLLAFASVLMTYFGVNYYLSGLHSYASGDPVPVPKFVYYTLAVVLIIAAAAWYRNIKFSKE
ncbi:MAG: cytochrome c biogenesis protein CcsA [Bacteroidales bacterium]|nr:cytochrome c biogenesis protein CcsA [Bacteroidales bacterium]